MAINLRITEGNRRKQKKTEENRRKQKKTEEMALEPTKHVNGRMCHLVSLATLMADLYSAKAS